MDMGVCNGTAGHIPKGCQRETFHIRLQRHWGEGGWRGRGCQAALFSLPQASCRARPLGTAWHRFCAQWAGGWTVLPRLQ